METGDGMQDKLWLVNEYDRAEVDRLCRELKLSPLIAKILVSRGMCDTDAVRKFLHSGLEELYDPFLLKDMDRAAGRIADALHRHQPITIYGDYDVDGVTSTSILYDFLSSQRASVRYYIPDRMEEGYGLSRGAIDKILEVETALIITVDCGVSAFEEVEYINSRGVDIVITDHHECRETLPAAYAVVNPCRKDCTYPYKHLAGVGVAFKLIQAICRLLHLGDAWQEYLELAAVGTVADVVPLQDENRILVKQGLDRMSDTHNLGLRTLIENSGMKDTAMDSWKISFVLAPRINAAGRIGRADRAVRLFHTRDREEALMLVGQLNDENKYRQDTEAEILQQAITYIEQNIDLNKSNVIVVMGQDWHHGIIGIVASKITERYYRPTLLLATEDGAVARGSGRSIEGFNLFDALTHCDDLLEKYGGHALAAGLSIQVNKLEEFTQRINSYAARVMTEECLTPKVRIDILADSEDITLDSIREIDQLAPFGAGNPSPVFCCRDYLLQDIRTVGDSKHLKLKVADGLLKADAIGFHMGDRVEVLSKAARLDLACALEINTWNSQQSIQLNIRDVRPGASIRRERHFYHSLDHFFRVLPESRVQEAKGTARIYTCMYSQEWVEQLLNTAASNGTRTVVFINSLDRLHFVENYIINLSNDLKNCIKVCYTNCYVTEKHAVYIVVNPDLKQVELKKFSKVVFWGNWVNAGFIAGLLQDASHPEQVSYMQTEGNDFMPGEFIPQHEDLAAVYRYMKTGNGFHKIEDIFTAARAIAFQGNRDMNHFKLVRCLDIFEELGLMEVRRNADTTLSIQLCTGIKRKAQLQESSTFRRLQQLKKMADEAVEYKISQ